MFPLITCETHGASPAYIVCLHVLNGERAVHVIHATKKDFGEALCGECVQRRSGFESADELSLICAGHFAEMQKRWSDGYEQGHDSVLP
jgi:hypothetical protein